MTSPYIGRFAPTPSGLLHFGSLIAALASFLDARHAGGQWLLRIEDLDQTRSQADAERQILQALEDFGLEHDGTPVRQSERLELYRAQTERWLEQDLAYYCDCPRRALLEHGPVYPGTCSRRHLAARADHAVRVRDMLDSTPRQIWLYQLLGQPTPSYLHVPLIMREDGEKLSKRLGSTPLRADQAPHTLWRALRALAQPIPAELRGAPVAQQLDWAIAHWQPERLPATPHIMEHSLLD